MNLIGYLSFLEARIIATLAVAWEAEVGKNNQILFNDGVPGSPEKRRRSDADFPEVTIKFAGMPIRPIRSDSTVTFGDVSGDCLGGVSPMRLNWKVLVKTRTVQTSELDVLLFKAYEGVIRRGITFGDAPGVTMVHFGGSVRTIDDEGGTESDPDPEGTEHTELTIDLGFDVELQWSELATFNPSAPPNPAE